MTPETVSLLAVFSAFLTIPILVVFLGQQISRLRRDADLYRARVAVACWLGTALLSALLQMRSQAIGYLTGDIPYEPYVAAGVALARLGACIVTVWAFVKPKG